MPQKPVIGREKLDMTVPKEEALMLPKNLKAKTNHQTQKQPFRRPIMNQTVTASDL
jgi:hypothetical protein